MAFGANDEACVRMNRMTQQRGLWSIMLHGYRISSQHRVARAMVQLQDNCQMAVLSPPTPLIRSLAMTMPLMVNQGPNLTCIQYAESTIIWLHEVFPSLNLENTPGNKAAWRGASIVSMELQLRDIPRQ